LEKRGNGEKKKILSAQGPKRKGGVGSKSIAGRLATVGKQLVISLQKNQKGVRGGRNTETDARKDKGGGGGGWSGIANPRLAGSLLKEKKDVKH